MGQSLAARTDTRVDLAKAKRGTKDDGSSPDRTSPNATQAANNYAFATTTSGTFTNMSSGTTQLVAAAQDDTASTVTNIGFDFYLLGVRYTQFSASSNGYIRLGGVVSTTQYTLGSAGITLISAYGSDLVTSTTGKVHYKVTGAAPNRVLTVEFLNETIIYDGAGATADGTYQVRLYESTGVVEFVYGAMNRNSSTGFGGGMDPQWVGFSTNSTDNTYATVTTATNTANTTGAPVSNQPPLSTPIANLNTPVDGSRRTYSFTPTVPTAPTGLNFTGVTQLSMTLNWTDSPDETLYAIYRSTDGTNYTFDGTAVQNATSYSPAGLHSNTTYFWRVFAVSDGALSTALSGSQATLAGTPNNSLAGGGLWSNPAIWSAGHVPTNSENVTISDPVTMDTTAAVALNVTVASGGTLTYEATTARTLTVGEDVTINSGGTFQSAATGAIAHTLSLAGNLTNNGTLDFSTSGNTASAGITFTGVTNTTFSGTGATTDIRTMTINKGTSNVNTLELLTSNFTVQGVTTDVAGFLTLTNGTLKISGTFTMTNRVFTAAGYTINATSGFWLNNPNFTVAGQNGSPTESGLLRITQGTFNIGIATGNSMGFSTGSTITVEGGAVNATGRFGVAAATNTITYTQSAGTITVCTIGNASATLGSFDLGTSATSVVNISGGTIVVQLLATAIDYRYDAGTGPAGLTGGTLQLGNAASGAAKAFNLRGDVPNLVIDNTSAGHSATFSNTLVNFFNVAAGNVTINAGTTLNLNGSATSTFFFMEGATMTNNGTLTATNVNKRFYWAGDTAQTYTGTGVVTAPLNSWELDNPLGLTLTPTNNAVVARIILFTGSYTGSNKFTLGNGVATSGTVIIGNATTPTAAGTFDVPLTFNLGTGGEIISYNRTTTSRTTGPEVNPTRTLTTLTYDDNDVTHTLTIAGGDITVTGTMALTNGRVITGANNLIVGGAGTTTRTTGYVDGNFRKTYAAAGGKTFEVGTANGYSPAQVNNATAGAFPATMTVKAVQGAHPNVNAATSIQRYWTLTNGGLSSADLVFTYLPTDPLGNEAAYRVIRIIGGIAVSFPTSVVNAGTDTATLTGVTTFSDWTVGENSAPTSAPASISGLVTDANGQPMGGVVLSLSGGKSGRAITDGAGRYSFSNLETNSLYTISPLLTNFNFNPSSRTYSLVADRTDASFSGEANSIPVGNPVDTEMFFVRQNYIDFLGREPDVDGLNYWTGQIEQCGGDARCINSRRIDVSAAFFKESEFQDSGSYIYRLYRGALGRQLDYAEFSNDRKGVVGGANLEQSKVAFADAFVQRAEFIEKYKSAQTAESFVSNLIDTMRESAGVDLSGQYNTLLSRYQAGSSINQSRSLVVREAIDAASFKDAVYNHSFVLMEYYGYLKRDPDQAGLDFWINVLNNREPNNYRGMVCSFLTSAEYQKRFSSVVTHSNAECGQ
ncbi:MAG: DUF4214 domain-containing protein [Pyrinomonadaceae bacterium]